MDEWADILDKVYKKYYDLTFLKGKDFWKVESTMIDYAISNKKIKGTHFLKFIGKNFNKLPKIEYSKTLETPQKRLFSLGEALHNLENLKPNLNVPSIETKFNDEDFDFFFRILLIYF